ncbi:hypothetical protein OUZ56_030080 [Daphnia magna]|uniref:Uncharacterized protein n=1 Tax=Daphnia magna TaxID=35525 RepID=A0ABQ9ZQ80_9CRUS|nr:hypothetical protein OUZ56_030080 [Daphnia magna]
MQILAANSTPGLVLRTRIKSDQLSASFTDNHMDALAFSERSHPAFADICESLQNRKPHGKLLYDIETLKPIWDANE